MTTTKTEKAKNAPKAKAGAEKPKRNRRTAEQKIADLLAEVERVREREAAKELRADPALKLTAQAVRAINKALGEAEEAELVEALEAARGALAEFLKGRGLARAQARREAGDAGAGGVAAEPRPTADPWRHGPPGVSLLEPGHALGGNAPIPRAHTSAAGGYVVGRPVLGGLHHVYGRAA